MLSSLKQWMIIRFAKAVAKYRSKSTYPDSLELDLSELLSSPHKLNVAIIDDKDFPWREALENRGCKVTYFSDYTKPISQANQKLKTYNFSSFDIIVCDIHGVGLSTYPGMEGIGVMQELRKKHPFHVIAAYTGDPGSIYSKIKKQELLDKVFSRDWGDDDFLLNFDDILNIFTSPKYRWEFIRRRLSYLGVGENKIDEVRVMYVENVILGQMLKEKFHCSAEQTRELVTSHAKSINVLGLAKFGVGAVELASSVAPFFFRGG